MNAQEARDKGYYFEWESDWQVGSHIEEYGEPAYTEEPSTCEACVLFNPSGDVVTALGCIDDADDNYRATIEDELAAEI